MSFEMENFPAGFAIDSVGLAAFMERRAPGRDAFSTPRKEADEIVFTSGVSEGLTNGGTICGVIANKDVRSVDYGVGRTVPRPGHADFGQWVQFGRIPTGGGKNSGRMTAPLCAAGGICLQWLESRGIRIAAEVESIGGAKKGFKKEIMSAKSGGDSVGGTVRCRVTGLPPGIGGALDEGVESALSAALFAIPGVKGVEFGAGFECAAMKGSEFNDAFSVRSGEVVTLTNRQGGILGGRTSGMPVEFRVAFRPTPTIFKPQKSVDLATMAPATCEMKGRHDPCIVLRAVPVVEAAAALVLADAILADEVEHPRICLVLTGRTVEEDVAQYRAQSLFTDMVELRVDLLDREERGKAADFTTMVPVPVILTFRRRCDGGAFSGPEKERASFLARTLSQAAKKKPFAYVDLEGNFRDPSVESAAENAGTRIVRSLHKFTGPVKDIAATCRELVGDSGEIAKVAFMPHSLSDVSRLFSQVASASGRGKGGTMPPHLVMAMGPAGLATRVLAGRLGSLWTYASTGGLEGIGHVTPHELVRDYRFRSVSRRATLFGVTGWPLAKTRSPELHNAAFLAEDEDALMIPYPSKTAREAFAFMRAMDMKGIAVTIPHKQDIIPLLDGVDASARKIGAVNTVLLEEGRYVGYNTDVEGFAAALSAFAGEVKGKTVAVLGDGGAAQAVKAALAALGAKFEVFHRRTPPPGFDIIVNATPVDPIPDYVFDGSELVYDLGYVPETTPLMKRAAEAGCRVENGFGMLQAQACGQRRIWKA